MIYWIDESYVRDNLPVEYSLLSGNILPALQGRQYSLETVLLNMLSND